MSEPEQTSESLLTKTSDSDGMRLPWTSGVHRVTYPSPRSRVVVWRPITVQDVIVGGSSADFVFIGNQLDLPEALAKLRALDCESVTWCDSGRPLLAICQDLRVELDGDGFLFVSVGRLIQTPLYFKFDASGGAAQPRKFGRSSVVSASSSRPFIGGLGRRVWCLYVPRGGSSKVCLFQGTVRC